MTISSIRLTSPQELLAIVPFVLGFNPTNSIMVLCLTDRRLGLMQRLDLPNPEQAKNVASALLPSLVKEGSCDSSVGGFRRLRGRGAVGTCRRDRAWQGRRVLRVSGTRTRSWSTAAAWC